MSNQTTQDQENKEQSNTQAADTPPPSENVTIRRPQSGTIVILAPRDTATMLAQKDEYLKLVLRLGTGE